MCLSMKDLADLVPKSILNKSGSVLYSGTDAFESQSDIYVLGVNPGGDPKNPEESLIGEHIAKTLNKPDNWSEYRDESWLGKPPGTMSLQKRILHLFKQLCLDAGEVPASNLIFTRSQRRATLEGNFSELVQSCWPLHEAVIKKLDVRVVVCLGQDCGKEVCDLLKADCVIDRFVENNERKWKSTLHANKNGLKVAILSHPGIANWTNPEADPTGLVQQALSN